MANELIGVRELNLQLSRIDRAMGIKTLRSALFKATTPVVRQMKSRIPVGSEPHRTYRKRLVGPGFARRSIKRVTGKKYIGRGTLSIAIGTRAEAWYAFLYDLGPYTISTRRQQTDVKARGHFGNQRRHINIKPYTLRRRPWFFRTFTNSRNRMISAFADNLENELKKVARSG